MLTMENTGCTFEETVQALRDGRQLEIPKYLSTGSMVLEEMDGTVTGGRSLIETDLYRPDACYRFKNDLQTPLINTETSQGFGFTFPQTDKFYTNGSQQGRANMKLVGDKVVELCGKVHVKQSNSVMMMLSQSGLTNLKGGISAVNSTSNEHAPVDYALSKNEETGAITITYSSPEELPFKFSWTSTIDVNGNVTSTPMTVEKKKLDPQIVSNTLNSAATRMGVNLTEAQQTKAANFIGELGRAYKLEGKKLDLFANFVVRLNLTDKAAEKDTKFATDMAKNISHWTEFEIGQGEKVGVGQMETTIKNIFNEMMNDALDDAALGQKSKNFTKDPDISNSMKTDAHRTKFIFNGQQIEQSQDKVISSFKNMVKSPNMRSGLSAILNQSAVLMFSSISLRADLPETKAHPHLNSGTIPGCDKMVSRDIVGMEYGMGTLNETDNASINLEVKNDNTATLIIESHNELATGAGPDPQATYGNASFKCVLQIDLTGDKPIITDSKLSQTFDVQ